MQWALAGAKRLECGGLPPLCFYAQTTCLEPDRHGLQNNVSVPISALVVAKRLECGSLLPLCSYPQTTCLSPYRIFPISPMTGHATRFDPANRATEHTPVGCGEESSRSCRRVRRNTGGRERGRPRPHQRDDRPYDPFGSCKSCARTFTARGCTNNVSVPMSISWLKAGERDRPELGSRKRPETVTGPSWGNTMDTQGSEIVYT